jgi:Tfp pilus assembly protein PilX
MTSQPHSATRRRLVSRAAQRGVTLLFALLALLVIVITTLAVVRSVGTNSLILGNIGFKQDATATAAQAVQTATNWLKDPANAAVLNASDPSAGYALGYAASIMDYDTDGTTLLGAPMDVTNTQYTGSRQVVDWNGDNCSGAPSGTTCTALKGQSSTTLSADNTNTFRYVIFRLCNKAGDPNTDSTVICVRPLSYSSGGGNGAPSYHPPPIAGTAPSVFYRIVVRAAGARNAVSFTETIVQP